MKQYEDQHLQTFKDSLLLAIADANARQLEKYGIQKYSLFAWLAMEIYAVDELSKAVNELEKNQGSKDEVFNKAIEAATICLKIAEMVKTQ